MNDLPIRLSPSLELRVGESCVRLTPERALRLAGKMTRLSFRKQAVEELAAAAPRPITRKK